MSKSGYERRYVGAVARQVAYKLSKIKGLKTRLDNGKLTKSDFEPAESYVKRAAENTKHALGVREDDTTHDKEVASVRKAATDLLSTAKKRFQKE